jgi:hypothetical protein
MIRPSEVPRPDSRTCKAAGTEPRALSSSRRGLASGARHRMRRIRPALCAGSFRSADVQIEFGKMAQGARSTRVCASMILAAGRAAESVGLAPLRRRAGAERRDICPPVMRDRNPGNEVGDQSFHPGNSQASSAHSGRLGRMPSPYGYADSRPTLARPQPPKYSVLNLSIKPAGAFAGRLSRPKSGVRVSHARPKSHCCCSAIGFHHAHRRHVAHRRRVAPHSLSVAARLRWRVGRRKSRACGFYRARTEAFLDQRRFLRVRHT